MIPTEDRAQNNQRGGALIFVTIVGLVMTLGLCAVHDQHGAGGSARRGGRAGQEPRLLGTDGQFQLCPQPHFLQPALQQLHRNGNNKDTDLAPVLQAYFNELSNKKTWTYPDESASYTITTTDTAAADEHGGAAEFQRLADGDVRLYDLRACFAARPASCRRWNCGCASVWTIPAPNAATSTTTMAAMPPPISASTG